MPLFRCLAVLFALAASPVLLAPAVAAAAQEAPAEARPAPPPSSDKELAARGQRRGKGSGFWTSDVPSEERPYRWGYLLVGLAVASIMGVVLLLVIRKAARQRNAS